MTTMTQRIKNQMAQIQKQERESSPAENQSKSDF